MKQENTSAALNTNETEEARGMGAAIPAGEGGFGMGFFVWKTAQTQDPRAETVNEVDSNLSPTQG